MSAAFINGVATPGQMAISAQPSRSHVWCRQPHRNIAPIGHIFERQREGVSLRRESCLLVLSSRRSTTAAARDEERSGLLPSRPRLEVPRMGKTLLSVTAARTSCTSYVPGEVVRGARCR